MSRLAQQNALVLGIALGQHELQTGDRQIGQRGVQLRDFADPAAALDNAAQAAPGSPGQRQGQRQHQAEAESKLAGHAEISEPGVHKNSPLWDVSGLAGELFLIHAGTMTRPTSQASNAAQILVDPQQSAATRFSQQLQ